MMQISTEFFEVILRVSLHLQGGQCNNRIKPPEPAVMIILKMIQCSLHCFTGSQSWKTSKLTERFKKARTSSAPGSAILKKSTTVEFSWRQILKVDFFFLFMLILSVEGKISFLSIIVKQLIGFYTRIDASAPQYMREAFPGCLKHMCNHTTLDSGERGKLWFIQWPCEVWIHLNAQYTSPKPGQANHQYEPSWKWT